MFAFDNKKVKDDTRPRIGVIHDESGAVDPITAGNASVLAANDLESISLLDEQTDLYAAISSLGVVHTFRREKSPTHSLRHISKGQLPVPDNESTRIWSDENRTNIEASRIKRKGDGTYVAIWGARGGLNYAGIQGPQKSVWVRWAPFNPDTGSVDEAQIKALSLPSIGTHGAWRALASLDFDDQYLYFASAYDGEEDGHELEIADPKRISEQNQAAFRSKIGRVSLASGSVEILASFLGMKVEAIVLAKDLGRLYLASDDEGLGSLLGYLSLPESDSFVESAVFVNLGQASSRLNPEVQTKRFGTSGMALHKTIITEATRKRNHMLDIFEAHDEQRQGLIGKIKLLGLLTAIDVPKGMAEEICNSLAVDGADNVSYVQFLRHVFPPE